VKEKFRIAHSQGVFVDRPIDNPIINDQSTVHERHEERRIITPKTNAFHQEK